jgi:Domain of unknown function (DUF4494)
MLQFEIKVKYPKEVSGSYKKVTESYLLANCESFTEAEALAGAVIFDKVKGETSVESISKKKYQYIIHNKKSGEWFKCTTALSTTDTDNDKVTTVKNDYLVKALDIDDASAILQEFIGDSMGDLDISTISRTKIYEVLEDKIVDIDVDEEEPVEAED